MKTTWDMSKKKLAAIQTSMKIKAYEKQIYDYYNASQPSKVALIEGKLNSIGVDDMGYADAQVCLGDFFLMKFLEGTDMEDIDKAVLYYKNAVSATPSGSDQLQRKHNLGTILGRRFQKFGDMEDLNAALALFQSTVDGTPANHSSLSGRQTDLAVAYTDYFQRLGHLEDLEKALSLHKTVVDTTTSGHPDLVQRQAFLAASHRDRYKALGNLNDLEAALNLRQMILKDTPTGHASLPSRQENLAFIHADRFKRLGTMEDLKIALRLLHSVLNATPPEQPDHAKKQQNLGIVYGDKYQQLGNLEDLQTALDFFQKSVNTTPPNHPDFLIRQQNLAASYTDYYRRLGNIEHLDTALNLFQSIVDATPQGHGALPGRQQTLAGLFVEKFRRFGSVEDLKNALVFFQMSVDGTPVGHLERPQRQHDLAVLYGDRYQRLGNLEDLETSLSLDQGAIDALPKDHPALGTAQHSLSISYRDRYKRLGNIQDLEAALSLGQNAVENTALKHPDLLRRQLNLAHSYSSRYGRLLDLQDLQAAITLKQSGVDNTPSGHPDLPKRQQSLSRSYTDRYNYDKLKNLDDFKTAFDLQLLAVSGTPLDHPDLPTRQLRLAGLYKGQYKMDHKLKDLQVALDLNLSAVNTIPVDHPRLCDGHQVLAQLYIDSYEHSKDQKDLQNAFEYGMMSIHSEFASPLSIWHAAQTMAAWATELKHPKSLQAYSAAFNIVPEMLWIGHSIDARHETLVQQNVAELSASAVQAAINHNELPLAVEFFEQGLAITHQQLLQLKTSNLLLFEKFPEHASKLKELSWQLLPDNTTSAEQKMPATANLNVIADKRHQLIKEIRKLAGFSRFLLPPLFQDLALAAEHGPVIILNCGSGNSDAIIVFPLSLGIKHISLPQITLSQAHAQLNNLRLALSAYRIGTRAGRVVKASQKNDQIFQSILTWLWKSLVQPIFNMLQENGFDKGRIWWCPSGPYTYLPIHAAAPLNSPYIQSYTLTLQDLIHAQEKQKIIPFEHSVSLTAVGVSDYTNQAHSSLPLVKAEIDQAEKSCRSSSPGVNFTKLLDSDATVVNVMKHIGTCNWLHIACHGQQNHVDPMKSSLLLYDGDLELKQIVDMDLPVTGVKFVFLSACQTAMGNERLANEAMHLAGGFIAAGFQGAIGTLWNMADADGPKVAEGVYQKVFSTDREQDLGHQIPDVTLAAEGLHEAIKKLRIENAPFHQWIPYIHFGI